MKLARLKERQILERAAEEAEKAALQQKLEAEKAALQQKLEAERAALQLKLDQNEALGDIAIAEAKCAVWSKTRSRHSQSDDTSILATAAETHAFTLPRSSQPSANVHVPSLEHPSHPGTNFVATDNRRQLEPVHGSFIAKTSVDDFRQISTAVQIREELSLCSSANESVPSFYSQAKGFNSLRTLPESSSAELFMKAQHSSTMYSGKKAFKNKNTIAAVSHLSPSAQPYSYPSASQATLRVNSQHRVTEEDSQNIELQNSTLQKSVNHFELLPFISTRIGEVTQPLNTRITAPHQLASYSVAPSHNVPLQAYRYKCKVMRPLWPLHFQALMTAYFFLEQSFQSLMGIHYNSKHSWPTLRLMLSG